MTQDKVLVTGLRALGIHGCLPEERVRAQPFEIDLEIEVDLDDAARNDDLTATIDYSAVITSVIKIVETRQFSLLESLSSTIADVVLAYRGVSAVTVEVRKMRPPVPAHVASVGVRLRRTAGSL